MGVLQGTKVAVAFVESIVVCWVVVYQDVL
jgi:hypothetical protein